MRCALLAAGVLLAVTSCSADKRTPAATPAPDPIRSQASAADTPKPAPQANDYPITVERDVVAAMRDGTKLYADVYRPAAEGTFPVLVSRTPYDAQASFEVGVHVATRGYIAVLQDVRGRYRSEGEFYPFKHESEDGYDTVEWAAKLPGSNGRVGAFGWSYVGATALLAAVAKPPHLFAILPGVTASNYHEGWTYQGGALEQWFDESWGSGLAQDALARRVAASNPLDAVKTMPLGAYPFFDAGSPSTLAPFFKDWLAHPSYDEYWRAWSVEDRYDAIQIPAFHVGDWYDIFLLGTLRNYVGLKGHGRQRLRIGPGNHIHSPGEIPFGPEAEKGFEMLDWFDRTLKGLPEATGDKPVEIFVMGKNVWRAEEDWPLARAKEARYYLRAGGTLSTTPPGAERPDAYVYDPADPVPTHGGNLCCDPHLAAGPADQRSVESRKDVLTYSTPPFDHDVEVTGPVSVELYVRSTARDTDFTAKLVDVWPNGFAQNLTDGIVRMRYRDARDKPSFLETGKAYRVAIDLAGTSDVFLAGHRMRVEIASSNFPRFDRSLNTEESPEQGKAWIKATNTVLHESAQASAVVVQVVPVAEGAR